MLANDFTILTSVVTSAENLFPNQQTGVFNVVQLEGKPGEWTESDSELLHQLQSLRGIKDATDAAAAYMPDELRELLRKGIACDAIRILLGRISFPKKRFIAIVILGVQIPNEANVSLIVPRGKT